MKVIALAEKVFRLIPANDVVTVADIVARLNRRDTLHTDVHRALGRLRAAGLLSFPQVAVGHS